MKNLILKEKILSKKLETETIINFNDLEKECQISTRQKVIKNRMKKLGVAPSHTQSDFACYRVPKKWIKVSPPRKVSEAQRKAARERAKKTVSG